MKGLSAFILLVSLFNISCGQSKIKIDPEAIRFHKEADSILFNNPINEPDSSQLRLAVSLLDKALKIDSIFIIAYITKSDALTKLKEYKPALNAFDKAYNLAGNKNPLESTLGICYEKAGDTISANIHYKLALSYYKKVLDAISINSKDYNYALIDVAQTLVFLNRKVEADSILTTVGMQQLTPTEKELRAFIIKKSRKELLYPELFTKRY